MRYLFIVKFAFPEAHLLFLPGQDAVRVVGIEPDDKHPHGVCADIDECDNTSGSPDIFCSHGITSVLPNTSANRSPFLSARAFSVDKSPVPVRVALYFRPLCRAVQVGHVSRVEIIEAVSDPEKCGKASDAFLVSG